MEKKIDENKEIEEKIKKNGKMITIVGIILLPLCFLSAFILLVIGVFMTYINVRNP